MALRIRRGTESQRTGQVFNSGEIVWTTDLQQLWVGDGIAQGGVPAVGLNITGYGLTYNTSSHKIEVSGLTTDDITQFSGANNRWFTSKLAQDAVAPMFTSGIHTNIEFQYDEQNERINATVILDGAGINSVQSDPTPTLGGDLSLNTHNINGTGDIDITGTINSSGLGGDLDLNSNDITGTGNINITGTVTATSYGTVTGSKLILNQSLNESGLLIETNTGGSTGVDLFNVNTHHNDVDVSGAFFTRSRGTYANPSPLISGDGIFNLGFSGRTTDGTPGVAVAIGTEVDSTVGAGRLPGKFVVYTATTLGALTPAITVNSAQATTFGGRVNFVDGTAGDPSISFSTDGSTDTGIFHPGDGVICISTDATERVRIDNGGMRVNGFMKVAQVTGTLPNPPEAGMIVLDGGTFKGYNGSAWVDLN